MQLLVKADDVLLSLTVLQDNTGQETSTGSYKICCESLPNQAFVFLLKDKGVENLLLSQAAADRSGNRDKSLYCSWNVKCHSKETSTG